MTANLREKLWKWKYGEVLGQCGESTLKKLKPLSINRGKGSVIGQLTPVEHNRLTLSETVSTEETVGGYMEMMEYRNSARGHLNVLEKKSALKCYLEEMIKGTTMKQKAYGTLVFPRCTQKRWINW